MADLLANPPSAGNLVPGLTPPASQAQLRAAMAGAPPTSPQALIDAAAGKVAATPPDLTRPLNSQITGALATPAASNFQRQLGAALSATPAANAATPRVVAPQAGTPPSLTTAPTSASSAAAPQAPSLASMQAYLDRKSYAGNPLDDYAQIAPHFRLFMTTDQDIVSKAQNIGELRRKLEPGAPDAVAQVVIAETGITTYNIRDVRIKTKVAPNARTRNTTETEITITVVEPMGVGFLDSFLEAAKALNIHNHRKAFYFLELSFLGYEDGGAVAGNASGGTPGTISGPYGDYWLWQIAMTNIEVDFSAGGGVYKITAMPSTDTALEDDVLRFQGMLTIPAATIGEFASNLGRALTENANNRLGVNLLTYIVKVHPIPPGLTALSGGKDPNAFKITAKKPEQSSEKNFQLDKHNTPLATFAPGLSITDAITYAFTNSEEAQTLAKDYATQGATDVSNTNVNDRNVRESIVFAYETTVRYTGYEYYSGQYQREITIHVRPYYTQFPILSVVEKYAALDPATQKTMFDLLYGKGFLKKKYEYLYTGMNTEVTSLNVNMNFQWNAVQPKGDGAWLDANTVSKNARANPNNDATTQEGLTQSPLPSALKQLQDAAADLETVAAARADINAKITANNLQLSRLHFQAGQTAAGSAAGTALQKQIADLTDAKTALQIQQAKINASEAAKRQRLEQITGQPSLQSLGTSLSGVHFAEDYVTNAEQSGASSLELTHPVTFRQMVATAQAAGTGLDGQFHRDKSLYGALLEQLYTKASNNFTNIELGIRGDPFWLGQTDIDRAFALRGSDGAQTTFDTTGPGATSGATFNQATGSYTRSNFWDGDMTFLLTFRYPVGIGEGGQPLFRASDGFDGVYKAIDVEHVFSDGTFRQTIMAVRMPLIDLQRAVAGKLEAVVQAKTDADASAADQRRDRAVAAANAATNAAAAAAANARAAAAATAFPLPIGG